MTEKMYEYDAYGVEKDIDSADDNPFRYCGEYYDSESGLIYLRNRYYDPEVGRFITEDPVKDGLNWYVYCGNNPVNYIDSLGLDAVVITNRNGARSSENGECEGIAMGHMAIVVQDANGDWYYFSCGAGYVSWRSVDDKYMSDISVLSEECYWDGMYYTDATYIKGDFSDSYDYFEEYYNNSSNKNANYSLLTNNCSTVVLEGLCKGKLKDGTQISTFIYTDINNNRLIGSPNSIMKSLQNIFYNSEFTKNASHKVINDLLWERRNGLWWNRSSFVADRLEKLH